jgi:hypothetical protein
MRRESLFGAAAVVLVANVFTLAHAWRNRSGPVEADVTLTQRELERPYNFNADDSEVALNLRWNPQSRWFGELQEPWLDQKVLRELGFDTSVSPSSDGAPGFYQRQRPRRAFVALEYDGPAWRKWLDSIQQQIREHPELPIGNQPESATHLIAIDAGSNALQLRAEHPDRGSVIIVPAVVRIAVQPYYLGRQNRSRTPPRLVGFIQDVPSSIHIPQPFSNGFQLLPAGRNSTPYRVQLRYGESLEPWVVGVEISQPGPH